MNVQQRLDMLHRYAMAKQLGRPLVPGEVVKHLDGNKLNNDPTNLVLGTAAENTREHFEAIHEAMKLREKVEQLEQQIAMLSAKPHLT